MTLDGNKHVKHLHCLLLHTQQNLLLLGPCTLHTRFPCVCTCLCVSCASPYAGCELLWGQRHSARYTISPHTQTLLQFLFLSASSRYSSIAHLMFKSFFSLLNKLRASAQHGRSCIPSLKMTELNRKT